MRDDGQNGPVTINLSPAVVAEAERQGIDLTNQANAILSQHMNSRSPMTAAELAIYVECATERYLESGSASDSYRPA